MKTLIGLLLTAFAALAQDANPPPNYAVQFYGTNALGYPFYWPQRTESIGTNTTADAPWVVLTQAQLDQIVATNKTAFEAAKSNRLAAAQAALSANLADFLAKMDKIEAWMDKTSGTNTLSNNQRDNAINDICQTFKKLRRVLVGLYQSQGE